jgi:hypothetical protein
MITEGINAGAAYDTNVFRFKLDGVVKTITGAVTGNALYLVAGNPAILESVDGQKIEQNGDPIDFKGKEMEFVTKNSLTPAPEINPEHVLKSDSTAVDPPHGIAMQHVSSDEAQAIEDKQ